MISPVVFIELVHRSRNFVEQLHGKHTTIEAEVATVLEDGHMNLLTQDPQPADPSYRLIPLTQGQFAKVDPEDYDWLMQWKWCAAWDKKTRSFRAIRSQYRTGRGPECIRMHREIMKAPKGILVDHGNHDTLDNRRFNLRKATGFRELLQQEGSQSRGLAWCREPLR